MADEQPVRPHLRTPWSRSRRPVPRVVLGPIQSFLRLETSGAIVLLAATMVALVWANSPWSESYERLWTTTFTVRIGEVVLSEDLRHWINDGLMPLFFLIIGLEIKRELVTGELRQPRSVLLPALAALGGMVVPAAIYAAINAGGPAADGWGIPMATDIAFALGVLTLAARNAPPGLKPFLLTLALVDDIGAIVVIALFYSGGVEPGWVLVALGIVAAIVALQRIQVRWVPAYVLLGIALWFAVFESGVHATIAGVILGLLTPALPFQRPDAVSAEAKRVADLTVDDPSPPDADAEHWLDLARLSREAVSPLARLEEGLHPWTSLLVIPLFALANAGVRLSGGLIGDEVARPVVVGILLGLIVGKFVGVAGATLGAVRLGLGPVPEGVGRRGVFGVASVAGVGFTIALFIADLSLTDPVLLDAAKVGILAASVVAGGIGFVVLRRRVGRAGGSA